MSRAWACRIQLWWSANKKPLHVAWPRVGVINPASGWFPGRTPSPLFVYFDFNRHVHLVKTCPSENNSAHSIRRSGNPDPAGLGLAGRGLYARTQGPVPPVQRHRCRGLRVCCGRGAPNGSESGDDPALQTSRGLTRGSRAKETTHFVPSPFLRGVHRRPVRNWSETSSRFQLTNGSGGSPDPAVAGTAGLQVMVRCGSQEVSHGWRPTVGRVARSGDLATTCVGVPTIPGSYFQPVRKYPVVSRAQPEPDTGADRRGLLRPRQCLHTDPGCVLRDEAASELAPGLLPQAIAEAFQQARQIFLGF